MRGSGVIGLLGAVIVGLIIADLWRNKSVTNNLISTSFRESKLVAGR